MNLSSPLTVPYNRRTYYKEQSTVNSNRLCGLSVVYLINDLFKKCFVHRTSMEHRVKEEKKIQLPAF